MPDKAASSGAEISAGSPGTIVPFPGRAVNGESRFVRFRTGFVTAAGPGQKGPRRRSISISERIFRKTIPFEFLIICAEKRFFQAVFSIFKGDIW